MAQRKAITRIGPQKTGFVTSKFAPVLGGYNWHFDPVTGVLLRRPGTERIAKPLREADEYSARGVLIVDATNAAVPFQRKVGAFGLFLFKMPTLLHNFSYSYRTTFQPAVTSSVFTPQNYGHEALIAIGNQTHILRTIHAAQTLSDARIKAVTSVIDGEKVTTLQVVSGPSVGTVSSAVATDSGAAGTYGSPITGTDSYQFDGQNAPFYFRCGEELFSIKGGSLGHGFLQAPFWDSSYVPFSSYFPVAVPRVLANVRIPITCAQIGPKAYIAGMGLPLFCFDGFRTYVAGCPRLVDGGSVLSSGGGGLTGTYGYKILKRVYNPDGSYTDGPTSAMGSASPAAQAVQITLPSLGWNELVNDNLFGSFNVAGASRTTVTAHKCTTWTVTGNTDDEITLADASAELRPGERIVINPQSSSSGLGKTLRVGNAPNAFASTTYTIPFLEGDLVGYTPSVTSAGDAWVILRTVNGGSVYYERAILANGTTMFSDNMSDATLTSTSSPYLETAYDRAPPPVCTTAVVAHQTRIVVAARPSVHDTRTVDASLASASAQAFTDIVWSEPNTEHFPAENGISMEGLCNNVTGLASVGDVLYILADNGIWAVSGKLQDAETFTLHQLIGAYGCASPGSVLVDQGQAWYLTTKGTVARLQNGAVEEFTGLLDDSDPGHVLDETTACATEDRIYFFVPYGTRVASGFTEYAAFNTQNAVPTQKLVEAVQLNEDESVCLVFDKRLGVFYRYKGIAANGGACVVNGEVILATRYDDGETIVRRFNQACPFDDGREIKMQIQAPFEAAEVPHVHKTFSRLTVFDGDNTSEMSLNVKVERDWDEGRYIQQFPMDFRVDEGYGNQPYATDPYGDGVIPDKTVSLNNHKAKSLRVTIEHEDMTQNPVINGWALEYSDTTNEGREE